MVRTECIPLELRRLPQWVVWRWERREGGKVTKPPCQTNGAKAKTNSPRTWTSFERAVRALRAGGFDGIGFVLTREDPYVAWDLDHCRNPETGQLKGWAKALLEELHSYTEVTPSDTGLRVIVRAALPPGGRKKGHIEVYGSRRYITVTGRHLAGTPRTIEDRHSETRALHARIFGSQRTPKPSVEPDDDQLIARAQSAANGARFLSLWNGDTSAYTSHSEADLALCGMLAFWTRGDRERVDRLFRRSQLCRRKWDENHRAGGATYGQMTI
ncbi:unnamed protein product, partial [marine sediment metagenome]